MKLRIKFFNSVN